MKLIKRLVPFLLVLGFRTIVFPQSGSIIGRVTSINGDSISGASVYLSESKWHITNDDGMYSISTITPGNYSLIVTNLGYTKKTIPVEIKADQTLSINVTLEIKVYKEKEVLITASRSEKSLDEISVPVAIVDQEEIETTGSIRLTDILDEQIGMNVVSNHGTGIQVQGFDPDYTLILIDNQPVIGRTAGTLNLERLAVGNVEQIEIVKGPSSALWGSNALAGVINIITEKAEQPFKWNVNGRYGTHDSYDGSSNLSFKKGDFSGQIFGNINSSNGYDLSKNTVAPTIPKYDNYTFSGEAGYRLSKKFSVSLNSRYYRENQTYDDRIDISNQPEDLNGTEFQENFSVAPSFKLLISDKQLFEATAFLSSFESESNLDFQSSGESYFNDSFGQTLNKYEIQSSTFWNNQHTTIAGIGMNREDLTADIYADVPFFDSYFGFGQHEWELNKKLSLTTGFRFDAHSEYSSQLSPKFSALYKSSKLIHIRGSFGGGFKAPDFRQLFLNFTNPIAGYSVFGRSTVEEGIERLQQDGQIEELYVNPSELTDIQSESSIAYNLGFDLFLTKRITFKINGFRNNVDELIETQRIALKTNGQSVFSYVNLNKIYTQGFETELSYSPDFISGLNISAGYQYLDAQREITFEQDDVQNGQVVTVTKKEYIPLFNRSKHTANFKLFYAFEKIGLDASLRIRHRGKYWFSDNNVNNSPDENEYAENHTMINTSIAKQLGKSFKIRVGINNLNNYKNEILLPSNPGTTFYTQLNINIY